MGALSKCLESGLEPQAWLEAALSDDVTFTFGEALDFFQSSPESLDFFQSSPESVLATIRLFAWGTCGDWVNRKNEFLPLRPAHQKKLQLLSFVSACTEKCELPLVELSSACLCESEKELHMLISAADVHEVVFELIEDIIE